MERAHLYLDRGGGRHIADPPNNVEKYHLPILSYDQSAQAVWDARYANKLTAGQSSASLNFLEFCEVANFGDERKPNMGIDIMSTLKGSYRVPAFHKLMEEARSALTNEDNTLNADAIIAPEHSAVPIGVHLGVLLYKLPILFMRKNRGDLDKSHMVEVASWTTSEIDKLFVDARVLEEVIRNTGGRFVLADDVLHTTHTLKRVNDLLEILSQLFGRSGDDAFRITRVVTPYLMAFTEAQKIILEQMQIPGLTAGVIIRDMGIRMEDRTIQPWVTIQGVNDRNGNPAALSFKRDMISS